MDAVFLLLISCFPLLMLNFAFKIRQKVNKKKHTHFKDVGKFTESIAIAESSLVYFSCTKSESDISLWTPCRVERRLFRKKYLFLQMDELCFREMNELSVGDSLLFSFSPPRARAHISRLASSAHTFVKHKRFYMFCNSKQLCCFRYSNLSTISIKFEQFFWIRLFVLFATLFFKLTN